MSPINQNRMFGGQAQPQEPLGHQLPLQGGQYEQREHREQREAPSASLRKSKDLWFHGSHGKFVQLREAERLEYEKVRLAKYMSTIMMAGGLILSFYGIAGHAVPRGVEGFTVATLSGGSFIALGASWEVQLHADPALTSHSPLLPHLRRNQYDRSRVICLSKRRAEQDGWERAR